ncbi:MAG: glycosyltransferase family 2 protein [Opitutaceae bacterium]
MSSVVDFSGIRGDQNGGLGCPGLVSIIVPCRNEIGFVERSISSLLRQKTDGLRMELLVADGLSDDGTRGVLDAIASSDDRLRVIDNSERTTPAALALLLEESSGEFLVRADAHSEYPDDYVFTLVEFLRQEGADNVGGVWDTQPGAETLQARAIAAALTSRFGVGVSYRNRRGDRPIEAETVPFGAWRRAHFDRFGPFDPWFVRAQDLEHNIRVRRMGGRIVCLPWLKIRYFARRSLGKLGRMAFDYGYWKIPVRAKHPVRFSVRQFMPPALVAVVTVCLFASIWYPPAALPVLSYLFAVVGAAVLAGIEHRSMLIVPYCTLALVLMHFGYGVGYFCGLIDVHLRHRFAFEGENPVGVGPEGKTKTSRRT